MQLVTDLVLYRTTFSSLSEAKAWQRKALKPNDEGRRRCT